MLKLRVSTIVPALFLVAISSAGANAESCNAKQRATGAPQNITRPKSATRATSPPPPPPSSSPPLSSQRQAQSGATTMNGGIKVLAEGGYSRVADAFVAVAQDAETYQVMRSETGDVLPEMSADFFKANRVVAAFLGTRRTGGYGVQITTSTTSTAAGGGGSGVRIAETAPAADMMTTQAITTPFKIVAVPISGEAPLTVEAESAWQAAMRPYQVNGTLAMSGSIAKPAGGGGLKGELRVMRHGTLATLLVDVRSGEASKARSLKAITTGVVQPNGQVTITHLDAGALVDKPRSAFRLTGQFTKNTDNLTLMFTAAPSNVSGGFSGSLEAVATAPPPQKRKPASPEDEPM